MKMLVCRIQSHFYHKETWSKSLGLSRPVLLICSMTSYHSNSFLLCPACLAGNLLGNGLFWAHRTVSLASILAIVLRGINYILNQWIFCMQVILLLLLVAGKSLWEQNALLKSLRSTFRGNWISQSIWDFQRSPCRARFVLTTQKSAMLPMDWKETRPSEEVCRNSSDITLV